jgi:DNA modification methylase
VIKDFIDSLENDSIKNIFKVAFGATLVKYSNYSYEPSLGTREASGKPKIEDYDVGSSIESKLREMLLDVSIIKKDSYTQKIGKARIIVDSFFNCREHVKEKTVDLIVTSPPYLNNYHYIRNTRPQLYWLDLVLEPKQLKHLEQDNFGKYWQTVRQEKQIDLIFKSENGAIEETLDQIRKSNNVNRMYGGPGWANYAASYFNDCYRFSKAMKYCLKDGGKALVVIGNNIIQGIPVPTDIFLGQIAVQNGLELVDIHIPRRKRIGDSITQSTVRIGNNTTKTNLYEAIVELSSN